MIERKNIDRLFQEKFKDFEVAPSEKIWENIEAELKEKKKRRVIPFWWRLSGVAAALIIGLFISYRLVNSNSDGKPEHKVVLEDKNSNNQNSIESQNQNKTNTNNQQDNLKSTGNIIVDHNSAVTSTGTQDKSDKNETNEGNHSDISNVNSAVNSSIDKKSAVPKMVNRNQSVANTDTKRNKESHAISNKNIDSEKENVVKNNAENAVANISNNTSNHGVVQSEIRRNKKSDLISNKGIASEKENSVKTNTGNTVANVGNINNSKQGIGQSKDIENKSANPNLGKIVSPLDKNPNTANNIANQAIENKSTDSKSNPIAETADKKIDSTAIATVVPNALEELLNEKENKVTTKGPKLNRWQVASSVAPIYFSSTSNGSPLDSRFESNKKSYKPTVAYGVGVKYALNKKLAVRSGVSSVKLEYDTSDLVFFQTNNARQIQNVKSNIQGAALQIDNKPTELSLAARAGENKFDATLNQKTGYIEVPVELSYKLIDKKFGVELIGGVSTLFLNQNEVTLQTPGLEMNIGEANNLNDLHFSTNVGVGVKYNFLKSFQANFEPTFKYQMNTFSNNAGNFKPYFFGFYTGVSYSF